MLLSRPFWIWGAEMGSNEFGVTIGNEAVFTREPYAKTGLTGMDLVRLALERAATADEAVRTIVSLIETFGQGGGCGHEHRSFTYHNSFIVADPRGAWSWKRPVAIMPSKRCAGARSISNGLTIPGFAERHSDTIRTHFSACRLRRARTQQQADRAMTPADLVSVLRDHGPSHAPSYSWINGGLARAVRSCRRAGGLVADDRFLGGRAAARGLASLGYRHRRPLHRPVQTGGRRRAARPGPVPHRSGRRAIAMVAPRTAAPRRDARPARLGPLYWPERDEVEAAWLADPPDPSTAFATADELLTRWTETVLRQSTVDTRPLLVRRYWQRRNRRAGLSFEMPMAKTAVG